MPPSKNFLAPGIKSTKPAKPVSNAATPVTTSNSLPAFVAVEPSNPEIEPSIEHDVDKANINSDIAVAVSMPTLKSYLLSTPSTAANTPTTTATPTTPAIADLLTFLTVPNITTAPDIARINVDSPAAVSKVISTGNIPIAAQTAANKLTTANTEAIDLIDVLAFDDNFDIIPKATIKLDRQVTAAAIF